jgi:tyrosine decarboxylase
VASPAGTELEIVTLDWLGTFLRLPARFLSASPGPGGGVIQGSAGEAAIVVLLAAACRARDPKTGGPLARERCAVYCSDQAHAIVQKVNSAGCAGETTGQSPHSSHRVAFSSRMACRHRRRRRRRRCYLRWWWPQACMVLGLHFVALPTTASDGFRLRGHALAAALDEALAHSDGEGKGTGPGGGYVPVAVVATSGTTTSCAFDPLGELAAVCGPRGVWLHVDAA